MKFLVIGLGSMGKRRVRNLQALDQTNIAGFDPKHSRCDEASTKYGIKTFNDFDIALKEYSPDIFIISTPPNLHMKYANIAYANNIHTFIEASVVESNKILELANKIKGTNLIIVPSCTMSYFPFVKKIKELLEDNTIGKPLNFNYQTGQFLEDWHPWEDIKDYYVSTKSTGAGREIVPFELTWLNAIFGDPKSLACVKKKVTSMDTTIDDIYHCILEYPDNLLANLTVEVVSRPKSTREFRLLGEIGTIVYSADTNSIRYINTSMEEYKEISFEKGTVESQYINPEEPYINEIKEFLNAIEQKDITLFPNSLEKDYKVLNTLYELEVLTGDDLNDLPR